MNIAAVGLWHLGTVYASCLAAAGHTVVALDFDANVISRLSQGELVVAEPGLQELMNGAQTTGNLRFTTDPADALAAADLVWVTYETPVDDNDIADVDYVIENIKRLFPHLRAGTLVAISSQVPVGSTAKVEAAYQHAFPAKPVTFAYSPENLRLGDAVKRFNDPDRVIVGTRTEEDLRRMTEALRPITGRIEAMSVEAAEMVKHAINSFLATEVVFINELATICEALGVDAQQVERGLRTDIRVGPRAYLTPGAAFAGGTLARDVHFLIQLNENGVANTELLSAVLGSNERHKAWAFRRLKTLLGGLNGKTIAIWGIAYKAGTDTLRRSSAVELASRLAAEGARVLAYDPSVKALPAELRETLELRRSPLDALAGADALVIETPSPLFREVPADEVVRVMRAPVVIDPSRYLGNTLGTDPRITFISVGRR